MTTRPKTLTSYAAAGVLSLTVLVAAMAGAETDRSLTASSAAAVGSERGNPVCRKSASTVASKQLRTKRGKRLGMAKITLETRGGDTIVCGIVKVRKPVRKRSTLVTLNLRERSEDGADLGQAKAIQRATQLSPPSMSSSFRPTGNTFIFRAKIDADHRGKARAKIRHTVG